MSRDVLFPRLHRRCFTSDGIKTLVQDLATNITRPIRTLTNKPSSQRSAYRTMPHIRVRTTMLLPPTHLENYGYVAPPAAYYASPERVWVPLRPQ